CAHTNNRLEDKIPAYCFALRFIRLGSNRNGECYLAEIYRRPVNRMPPLVSSISTVPIRPGFPARLVYVVMCHRSTVSTSPQHMRGQFWAIFLGGKCERGNQQCHK